MHEHTKLIGPLLSRLRAVTPGGTYPLDPVERELILNEIERLTTPLGTFTPPQRTNDPQAVGPIGSHPFGSSYLEHIRAHVDADGRLNHANGVFLLEEVERLHAAISTFLEGRMRHFTDSRAVDDDLVVLARAAAS